ncbi:tyrosine-type recombinase/integrase [Geodermatophilus sp. CPCC 205761]|uniref:tyrosine-type recombinase/integrase n=1 Tax=Geodermatophilus sp. CPCC 205761 TaxID=2936597 RepID=UPI003EF0121C
MIRAETVALFPNDGAAPKVETGWQAWLAEHTSTPWRPGEWDSDTLLFIGDLDNPMTRAFRCLTPDCDAIVGAMTRCTSCGKAKRKSGLTDEAFDAIHRSSYEGRRPTQRTGTCLVEGCTRGRHALEVCRRHYARWRRKARQGAVFADWLLAQEPLPPAPSCRVAGCPNTSENTYVLCAYHRGRWKRDLGRDPDLSLTNFIARGTPFLGAHMFSLRTLHPQVRAEPLYALAERDSNNRPLDPTALRGIVAMLSVVQTCLDDRLTRAVTDGQLPTANERAVWSTLSALIQRGHRAFRGVDPTASERWDLVEVGLPRNIGYGRRVNQGTLDFGGIRQPWLRELALDWGRVVRPHSPALREMVRAASVASHVLGSRADGGNDPAVLTAADMSLVFQAFVAMTKKDGTLYTARMRSQRFASFVALVDYGRRTDSLKTLPGSFARLNIHNIKEPEQDEDNIGKSLPESVIDQLDKHLDWLGVGIPHGTLPPHLVQHMHQTIYRILRDTGRRPLEIAALRRECISQDAGGYWLIYDNHKAKRMGRRLPIRQSEAENILRWRAAIEAVELPEAHARWLFPAATTRAQLHHLWPGTISNTWRVWLRQVPTLLSELIDPSGDGVPFDKALIFPYALRHSYAQRHADAGVDPETLRDLMDHKDLQTTQTYYQVSSKRKRQAQKVVAKHARDRYGNPTPGAAGASYELQSVAVPYGNCTEPRNVAAGGQSCPIRFQCAGCGFYRPDPSYRAAVEDEIARLRVNHEEALAMEASQFVIDNLAAQIEGYKTVLERIAADLARLPHEERVEIEQATVVLRKARAGEGKGRQMLPLTVAERHREDP